MGMHIAQFQEQSRSVSGSAHRHDMDANVAASIEVDEKGQAIRMSHTTDENL